MGFEDFTEMPVWKSAFRLLLRIYEVTKRFPTEERYGLVADLRRSANSSVHNIAEGFGRFEARDKARFYKIARGSAYEMISQILVSQALSYLREDDRADELIHIMQGVDQGTDRSDYQLGVAALGCAGVQAEGQGCTCFSFASAARRFALVRWVVPPPSPRP